MTNKIKSNEAKNTITNKIKSDEKKSISKYTFSELKQYSVDKLLKICQENNISSYGNKSNILFDLVKSFPDIEYDGYLELINDNHGFLRNEYDNFLINPYDIYVPPKTIKDYNLRYGDIIKCKVLKPKTEDQKYYAIGEILSVNNKSSKHERRAFEDLQAVYPNKQIEFGHSNIKRQYQVPARLIDLLIPIGFGQRALILAPPKAGKTTIMHGLATSILSSNLNVKLIILLIDERPEEVTDMYNIAKGASIYYSTFDKTPDSHLRVSKMVIEIARRMVEYGEDVILFVDSLTKLVRANNCLVPPSGRVLSGGIEASALYEPKRFFGSARNIEQGGSLTIIATTLVETGSKMDEYIYEEFKGTGNCEIRLDRDLAEKKKFPAFNLKGSGTRRSELLCKQENIGRMRMLEQFLVTLPKDEGLDTIINKIISTTDNNELLITLYAGRQI